MQDAFASWSASLSRGNALNAAGFWARKSDAISSIISKESSTDEANRLAGERAIQLADLYVAERQPARALAVLKGTQLVDTDFAVRQRALQCMVMGPFLNDPVVLTDRENNRRW